ncbi:GHMP family kinase ATP-binding protein [Streptomyces sp. NPDC004561]
MNRFTGRAGRASAPTHHGEILQGVFRHRGGLRRGLVTLPCRMHAVRAEFTPDGGGAVTVSPPWKKKARRAAELALTALGIPAGGHLVLSDDVPVGRGFGSSTADVVAAIGAVRDAFTRPLPREEVARLAVRAEQASDAVMFTGATVLFAHREGEVIEDFGAPLPPLRILGFGSGVGAGTGAGVDTLALPPARYRPREIGRFAELRGALRQAVRDKDVVLLGEVATASTRINQEHLPIPRFERILAVAAEVGATGVQTAHSGDIAGLIFDPADPDTDTRTAHGAKLLRDIGISERWEFEVDG